MTIPHACFWLAVGALLQTAYGVFLGKCLAW